MTRRRVVGLGLVVSLIAAVVVWGQGDLVKNIEEGKNVQGVYYFTDVEEFVNAGVTDDGLIWCATKGKGRFGSMGFLRFFKAGQSHAETSLMFTARPAKP